MLKTNIIYFLGILENLYIISVDVKSTDMVNQLHKKSNYIVLGLA